MNKHFDKFILNKLILKETLLKENTCINAFIVHLYDHQN